MNKLTRVFRLANTARLGTMLIALWKLFKHPQTPRGAKFLAIAVLAYAVSPIDLILVPLGVALVVRMTPKPLWQACLREAELSRDKLPRLWWGAAVVVLAWVAVVGGVAWWWLR